MFKFKDALEINKYGQNLTDIYSILSLFEHFEAKLFERIVVAYPTIKTK